MRLTTLCIGAALLALAPVTEAMAQPSHFAPPGHVKNHHGYDKHKHDRKQKRKNKRHHKRHHDDNYYSYYSDRHHKYCDHPSHYRHNNYWRVGQRFDRDYYRQARVLRRDRHGHVIVDVHGDVFRLLENSLEIIEIISRRH
ncbi:hypothetical protein AAEU32_11270 [Pseudoalteromonas sp. SSDWG2]|uniref:hypothetical protein n=1 Tax=Pseudoalteromonas sp. SSDWG2 TaxID=3139391 RepID=UPI003BAB78B3